MENLSQNEQIRLHLEAGKTITPLLAFYQFNCLRLGARINDLKKTGLAIHTKLIRCEDKHFAEYSLPPTPSRFPARDRYAMTAKLMEGLKSKKATVAVIAVLTLSSCAMQKPGTASLHRAVRIEQETQQYQASISSGKDWTRTYRNQYRRPHKMTRIPFTQLYIF